jgi:hypothetical protein
MESNYLELSDYGIQKTEAEKYRQLKRNLFVEGVTNNLCMQMYEKYPNSGKRFTRVIKWLRAKVMQLDYHRGTHAKKEVSKRRSARMAQTDVDEGAAEFIAAYDVYSPTWLETENPMIGSQVTFLDDSTKMLKIGS